jgi:hypothetical protein
VNHQRLNDWFAVQLVGRPVESQVAIETAPARTAVVEEDISAAHVTSRDFLTAKAAFNEEKLFGQFVR